MAPRCQTQLKFDLATQATEPAQDITESFAFRGKSYRAQLAPRSGVRLKVGPLGHRARISEVRDAFLAFMAEHDDRIEAAYRARYPGCRTIFVNAAEEAVF